MDVFSNNLYAAPVSRRLFDALAEHPYGLTMRKLIEIVYNGCREPEYAASSLQVCAMRFNRRAKAQGLGLQIRGSGGPGSKYQIWIVKNVRINN